MSELSDKFNAVYSAHFREIYSFIAYSVGRQSDAEDLTQEVFMKAYRAFGSFRGDAEVRTWLYAIARNTVRTHIARKKPAHAQEAELGYLAADTPLPDQVVTNREVTGLLHKALLQLSDTQRMIVILRNIHGYSTRETAQLMQCTETKVKVQLFRALRKLRRILAEDPLFYYGESVLSGEVRSL